MRKLLIAGGIVAGAAFIAKRRAASIAGIDFEQLIERMPENAPPKWMFRNVNEIRGNTERILRLLEEQRASAAASEREASTS